MKKVSFLLVVSLNFFTVLIIVTVLMCGCANNRENNTGISNEVQTVEKMFPTLDGVHSVQWEQVNLGSEGECVPGAQDYLYQGYVILDEEIASNYATAYEWIDAEPDVAFDKIEAIEGDWKYSYDFVSDIIPGYYNGSIWMDGNILLFRISTK